MSKAYSLPMTKAEFLDEFQKRLARGLAERKINNMKLPAGSLMYFDCHACGCQDIVVQEGYRSKPDLCNACQILKTNGWLDEALKTQPR